MFVRTTLNVFNKSRHKMMVKRRKVQLKNRPISNQKLKEEQGQVNIAYETKLMNIRKEMDRTKSPNHHLNEIIEELFYPEIKLGNEQDVDQRVRQVSSNVLSQEQNWEDLVRMDPITSDLMQSILPLELLEVHEKNSEQFLANHYQLLMEKMSKYCFRRDSIKEKRIENWDRMVKKIKSKDPKAKEARCPYLFLQREEIPRHEFWMNMVQAIESKMLSESNIIQLNKYVPILINIQKTFYHVPAQLYQLILNKNAGTDIKHLRGRTVSDLLILFKYRNKIKFNPNVIIDSPEENNTSKEASHLYLARKLATEVIDRPELYTAEDLVNIFKIISSRKMKMHILQQSHYQQIETIFGSLLNELSFESVQTFFVIYCTMNHRPSEDFAEIIKYDLFRKAEECENYFYLFDLVTRIRNRKLNFKVYQPKGVEPKKLELDAFDLLVRLTEVLTKMLDKLQFYQLVQLLDCYYRNDIRDQSVLEILSTEIIKKGAEFNLEVAGKSLFKLTVLGHSSKIAAKFVFQQFSKKYHTEMKKYQEEEVFLLPTEEPTPETDKMNFNQIYLQECLLMMLWAVNKQLEGRLQKEIYLTTMFDLFPVKVESGDPLALELAININAIVKDFGYFPRITCPMVGNADFPVGRLEQYYCKDFSKTKVELLLDEEAEESKLFTANFNPKSKMFLSERWSSERTYSPTHYINFIKGRATCDPLQKGNCFFDPTLILSTAFLAKRARIVNSLTEQVKKHHSPLFDSSSHTKQNTIYDLL